MPSTAVIIRVLARLGIPAEPMAVHAVAVDRSGLQRLQRGLEPRTPYCYIGALDPITQPVISHVVASISLDERHILVDASADQMEKPGLVVRPLAMEVSSSFMDLYDSGRADLDPAGMEWFSAPMTDHAFVGYRPTMTTDYQRVPAWSRDALHADLATSVLGGLVEEYGAVFLSSEWRPSAASSPRSIIRAVPGESRLPALCPPLGAGRHPDEVAALYRELGQLSSAAVRARLSDLVGHDEVAPSSRS